MVKVKVERKFVLWHSVDKIIDDEFLLDGSLRLRCAGCIVDRDRSIGLGIVVLIDKTKKEVIGDCQSGRDEMHAVFAMKGLVINGCLVIYYQSLVITHVSSERAGSALEQDIGIDESGIAVKILGRDGFDS